MMHDVSDINHVIFQKVPNSSFLTIKSRPIDSDFKYYYNLLQIVIRDNTVVYSIEDNGRLKEVESLQSMSALTDPDNFVQTGYSTSNSYDDAESGEIFVDELAMNEHKNLMMSRQRIFSPAEGLRTTYNGVLYRTFTELDLFEMERINECIRRKADIGQID